MKVFISHVYEERRLADALQQLLRQLSEGQIDAWFSSDPRPSGGMGLGDWRAKLVTKIEESTEILAIVTPESNGVAWVAWESGFAHGSNKNATPVVFYMEPEGVHSVYGNQMAYRGDQLESVRSLCAQLLSASDGRPIREAESLTWTPHIERFIAVVKDQQQQAYTRSLFHEHFHSAKKAAQMENVTWFAKWTHQPDGGEEEVFEVDSLICWSTDGRMRMVGDAAKGGVYPMEGVVSSDGHIALSYWSEGNIPICGVVLMEQADLKGDVLEGTWSGYTARSLEQKQLKYFRGRVVMAKDRAVANERWGLLPPAPKGTGKPV